jgi:hypothetical protein
MEPHAKVLKLKFNAWLDHTKSWELPLRSINDRQVKGCIKIVYNLPLLR